MGWFGRLKAWLSPPMPDDIKDAMQQAQFESVRSQVPMLLAVAALNTGILMAVCAQQGMAFANYGWLAGLIVYCVIRIGFWINRRGRAVDAANVARLLTMNVGASLTMITLLGMISALTFVAGTFHSMLLVPMSLGFGTLSIAHCLYTLRPAAIGTLIMGLGPSALAMLMIGPFEAQMLGLAMLSVGVLMVRFVAAQYDQLVASLLLAHENRRLALTDPLTGLANRRAIMAALNEAVEGGNDMAVALLDLDGFKQVNDRLGHHAGDALLIEVAARLSQAVDCKDHVGRLGGDEFVILFRDSADEAVIAARTTALLAALGKPLMLDGQPANFGASLGYARMGADGVSVEELLHSADNALYAAKRGNAGNSRCAKLAA
jgi:diguanylate cyclase